ncbi:MAG: hypothetical protein H7329_07685 [Opitutaceae bacterium]|nr:hypothetical protein [Cytophagales bacterium]
MNEERDILEIDNDPQKETFLVYYDAYQEVEEFRKSKYRSATYYDVIADIERMFLEYGTPKGYREDIQFAIVYVPLDVLSNPLVMAANPLGIPAELLLQAKDMILRN